VGQVERLFANKHALVFVSSDADGHLVEAYLGSAGMRVRAINNSTRRMPARAAHHLAHSHTQHTNNM
jgi:hypothetical protein